MTEISDQFMQDMLPRSRTYAAVLLRAGPNYGADDSRPLIWEHGRRNFALRAEGKLVLVGPVTDQSGLCGIGIFNTDLEEAAALMAEDPAVKAGIFVYEVHPWRSFPGDSLPEREK